MREAGAGANGVVCASAGNFGQGLAYAARAAAIPCHVFVGRSANPGKVDAMRRLGAAVQVGGEDYDAAIDTARSFAAGRRAAVRAGRPRPVDRRRRRHDGGRADRLPASSPTSRSCRSATAR